MRHLLISFFILGSLTVLLSPLELSYAFNPDPETTTVPNGTDYPEQAENGNAGSTSGTTGNGGGNQGRFVFTVVGPGCFTFTGGRGGNGQKGGNGFPNEPTGGAGGDGGKGGDGAEIIVTVNCSTCTLSNTNIILNKSDGGAGGNGGNGAAVGGAKGKGRPGGGSWYRIG